MVRMFLSVDVPGAPLLLALRGIKKGDQGLDIDAMHRAYSDLDAYQNSIRHHDRIIIAEGDIQSCLGCDVHVTEYCKE